MNKVLLIFNNKLHESVIFFMQLTGFWPGCILLHILNIQICCSKKYLDRMLSSSGKNNNQIAYKHKFYCNNITIVKLVWTVLLYVVRS